MADREAAADRRAKPQPVGAHGKTWGTHVNPERLETILSLPGQDILDIGCADGAYVGRLAQAGRNVVGLDIEFKHGKPRAAPDRVARASALALPFPEKSFDTAVAINVLEHVDDRQALREIQRVTRDHVFISVPHVQPNDVGQFEVAYTPYKDPTHLRYYTPESLSRTLEEEGFRTVWARAVHPVNAFGLALRTLGVPLRLAKAAGVMYNRLPLVRKFHYNVHAVAKVA